MSHSARSLSDDHRAPREYPGRSHCELLANALNLIAVAFIVAGLVTPAVRLRE
jgi:hypothetical protein